MARWTIADIPPQHGRSAVVTGVSGLGYETALALARAGGDVILAGRNPVKGAASVAAIRAAAAGASVSFELLDLADLASVAAFADRLATSRRSLDLLVNNAGIMMLPKRQVTRDGFEMQFGTNYLGPFALTARLLPLLRAGTAPRVVAVSSIAARTGAIVLDDLQAARRYRPSPVYGQSKLADLMFALELQRRSAANGWGIASVAAHPGVARTELFLSGPGPVSAMAFVMRVYGPLFFQSPAQGALPLLFAATSPEAVGGGYYGPDGLGEIRGYPTAAKLPRRALDTVTAARLWEVSEQLTGVEFGAPATA